MGVTVKIADHAAKKWYKKNVTSRESLLSGSCPKEYKQSKRIIQSSLSPELFGESHISPSKNGFVYAAYEAYSQHYHLTVRPDDIWFAILSQLNYYINANAEKLRSHFVSHDGQKELVIKAVGTIETYDFAVFARQMTELIQDNVKDPDFRDWIMPTFSTTKVDDRTVAAILMMGSMQAYFSYTSMLCCGIPSVTLLGNKEDYEDILQRLDKLEELGTEPTAFADLLRPILRSFIATFDPNQDAKTRDFWSKIAHYEGGSGMDDLSGWLTAFCFWRNDGKCLYFQRVRDTKTAKTDLPDSGEITIDDRWGFVNFPDKLVIDGIRYPTIDMHDIPNGWAGVPVKVNDNGVEHKTRMVAGSLGIQVNTSENQADAEEKVELDCVRSLSGWFMYELKDDKEPDSPTSPHWSDAEEDDDDDDEEYSRESHGNIFD